MSLIYVPRGGAASSAVTLPSNNFRNTGFTGTVYSGVKFGSDGNVYERQTAGGWSVIGTWLLNGTNSDFYIVRGTPSSALTTDAGAGPLVLSTDRIYDIQQSYVALNTTTLDFEIQNVGTDTLATNVYTFTAIKDI